MNIRRVVPNIKSDRMNESRAFYVDVLGFNLSMDMGWILTFTSPSNPTAQLSVIRADPSGIHPDVSIEVEDVDQVYASVLAQGLKVLRPIDTEPWGVRRFFVVDPNGLVPNILSHRSGHATAQIRPLCFRSCS